VPQRARTSEAAKESCIFSFIDCLLDGYIGCDVQCRIAFPALTP
jgi:hypothetical protein